MVANYRIVAKLGEGGMGLVYLAEHQFLGKKAAVKILLPELSRNKDIVNRFFNEARAATLVKHPGIVDIFDFGHHTSGCAYIAMELLEGESLAARMKRERLPIALIIELARQIASALASVHARAIVHRDLKPGNIFLIPDSAIACGIRVKLLDFGIAKLHDDHDSAFKTRPGTLMGTPVYMAPEQCRGAGDVDYRADIYALGCLVYTMVTGRPPFIAEGVGDIIAAHMFQVPVPIEQWVPSVPMGLSRLVTRMLAKRREDRPASMSELITELDALDGRQPSAPNLEYRSDLEVEAFRDRQGKTTLSESAFELEQTTPASARSSRWGWIVVSSFAATLGFSAIVYVTANRHTPAARPAPTPTPLAPLPVQAAPARPAAPPSPIEEPPHEPAKVKLRVESLPPGAAVYRAADGILLGTTPFEEELAPTAGRAVYILKLAGYRDHQVLLPANEDESLTARLVPTSSHGHGKKLAHDVTAPEPAPSTPRPAEPAAPEPSEEAKTRLKNDLKNPWN
jgi:serine/threonine-protein kinase